MGAKGGLECLTKSTRELLCLRQQQGDAQWENRQWW